MRASLDLAGAVSGLVAALALALLGAALPAPPLWGAVLCIAAVALCSAAHGMPFVRLAFALADPPGRRGAPIAGAAADSDTPTAVADTGKERLPPAPGTLRGGWLIGILERAATTAAVASGAVAAVAVVVAVKGIGRFGELDRPETRERFIVGTLASLAVAGLWGGVGLLLAL